MLDCVENFVWEAFMFIIFWESNCCNHFGLRNLDKKGIEVTLKMAHLFSKRSSVLYKNIFSLSSFVHQNFFTKCVVLCMK